MSIDNETESKYPKELKNVKLEYAYIGLLLENPKSISKYYLSFEDSQFSDPMAMNLYKSILFTEVFGYEKSLFMFSGAYLPIYFFLLNA